jgi:hypothetical protein
MIPSGAQKIVAARASGFRPADMVIVSFVGRVDEMNPTVYAHQSQDYDWAWLAGLQVCIYAAKGVDWTAAALGIAKAKPAYLGLWDAGRNEGAELYAVVHPADIQKPRSQWRWIIDYIPWTKGQNERFICN